METLTFLMTTSFYPPYHIGGDAIHVKYLAEELAKMGHEVHILYSLDAYMVKKRKGVKYWKNKKEYEQHENIYTHTIETPFNISSYISYITGVSNIIDKIFQKLVKQVKPDVVHHHNISLLGFSILKKIGNYLNFYTAHDYWLICQQNNLLKQGKVICEASSFFSCTLCSIITRKPPQFWRYTQKFKEIITHLDVIISPSEFLKKKIEKNIYDTKIVTLPNFAPIPPKNISSSGFEDFFLYAGVLEEHKGVMELLVAFKDAVKFTEPKLVIAGNGSLKTKMLEYIHRKGLEDRIIMLGYVTQKKLYPILKEAKAVIIPSKAPENCPLTALESLSVGTPIIVSNIGGLPEIANRIDKNLIFTNFYELVTILMHFDKNKYSISKIKKIYNHFYSPQAFLNKYFSLINNNLDTKINTKNREKEQKP